MCLFEAASAEDVKRLNTEAKLPYLREHSTLHPERPVLDLWFVPSFLLWRARRGYKTQQQPRQQDAPGAGRQRKPSRCTAARRITLADRVGFDMGVGKLTSGGASGE
jgi:hypothetical protein